MEPNEIRIGNWFMSAKHDVPFQWQASDFAEVYNTQAKPIPLSPEILLKCGLKQVEGDDNIWKEIKISDFDIVWWMSGLYFLTTDGYGGDFQFYHSTDEDSYWCINYHVKHLHQLQNLIFALTGEELTIDDFVPNKSNSI